MVTHKKNRFPYKYLLPVAAVFVYVLIALIFGLWPFQHKKSNIASSPTTSKAPSAQSSFTNGGEKSDNRVPEPSSVNSATDTGGSLPESIPDSATWSKSQDGSSIIVMSPVNNGRFSSGDTVYGTAASTTVSYELEDDVSGVILQGRANVIDGKFSIKFNFSTTGTKGQLNIFNQAADGVESNNASVSVRFK